MNHISHKHARVDKNGNIAGTVIDLEHKLLLRDEWLSEKGLDDGDVMVDALDQEYVYQEGEDGMEKVYLPNEIQTDHVPF